MSEPTEIDPGEREGQTLDFSGRPSAFVSPSLLAEALRRGWQISPERKRQYFAALDEAVRNLPDIKDASRRVQATAQCARVLVAEQGQAMRDVHHIESLQHEAGILNLRMSRAEEGKPNDCVEVQHVTPVRELPLPDALRSQRRRLLEPTGN